MMQDPKNPVVTEAAPPDWTSEQEMIAKDALAVLMRHFRGIKWGVEWSECVGNALGVMIIRMLSVSTKVVYVINPKDIDRDRMRCVVKAGGELLEAHGMTRARSALDRGLGGFKKTRAGLIVPDYAAIPDNNPGYEQIKKEYRKLYSERYEEPKHNSFIGEDFVQMHGDDPVGQL
jgi:hypothetical protein